MSSSLAKDVVQNLIERGLVAPCRSDEKGAVVLGLTPAGLAVAARIFKERKERTPRSAEQYAADATERLSKKVVKKGECEVWTGAKHPTAKLGLMYFGGRMQPVRRVAYQLAKGPIPDGMVVVATCDTDHCVHVGHLKLAPRGKGETLGEVTKKKEKGKKAPPVVGGEVTNAKQLAAVLSAKGTEKKKAPAKKPAAARGEKKKTKLPTSSDGKGGA